MLFLNLLTYGMHAGHYVVGMRLKIMKLSYCYLCNTGLEAIRLYCSNDTNVSTTKPPKQELRSKEGSQNIGWRGYVGTDSPIVGVWMRSEEFNGDGIHYTYKGDDMAATAVRFLDSKGRKYKAGEKILLKSLNQ